MKLPDEVPAAIGRPARLKFEGRSYVIDHDERQAWRGVEVVRAEVLEEIHNRAGAVCAEDVLAHWKCDGCGRGFMDAPLTLSHPRGDGLRCHGPVKLVEYVPRSKLRGAVEALERAHAALDKGHDHTAETWEDRKRWTAATLDHPGGQ